MTFFWVILCVRSVASLDSIICHERSISLEFWDEKGSVSLELATLLFFLPLLVLNRKCGSCEHEDLVCSRIMALGSLLFKAHDASGIDLKNRWSFFGGSNPVDLFSKNLLLKESQGKVPYFCWLNTFRFSYVGLLTVLAISVMAVLC